MPCGWGSRKPPPSRPPRIDHVATSGPFASDAGGPACEGTRPPLRVIPGSLIYVLGIVLFGSCFAPLAPLYRNVTTCQSVCLRFSDLEMANCRTMMAHKLYAFRTTGVRFRSPQPNCPIDFADVNDSVQLLAHQSPATVSDPSILGAGSCCCRWLACLW